MTDDSPDTRRELWLWGLGIVSAIPPFAFFGLLAGLVAQAAVGSIPPAVETTVIAAGLVAPIVGIGYVVDVWLQGGQLSRRLLWTTGLLIAPFNVAVVPAYWYHRFYPELKADDKSTQPSSPD